MVTMRQRRAREPHAPREFVDFASVPPSQWAMHDRLENWARWSRGSQKQDGQAGSPMFALYTSNESQRRRYGEETSVPVDKADALKLHFAITGPTFPDHERKALQWSYLRPRDPAGMARQLDVDLAGLRDLVRAGRLLLVDTGI